jgi:hypothetical protein
MAMRFLFLLALGLLSCGGGGGDFTIPPSVGDAWKLATQDPAPPEQAAAGARELGLKRLLVARYSGPGSPEVAIHQMTSGSGAFEMVQKWRPQPGTLAAHKGSLFFTVRSSGLDARELNRFLSLFEAALP